MKLKSIDLINYRNFQKAFVNLDPRLTVFIGSNGAGKTSLLDAIANFLIKIAQPELVINHQLLRPGDIRIDENELAFKFIYELNGVLASIDIRYDCHDDKYVQESFLQLKSLNDMIKASIRPVVVYYGSKRIINNYSRQTESHSEPEFAFKNAFNAAIDFSSTLTWFIEKSSQEALSMKKLRNLEYSIPELDAVRSAVSHALGEYNEPYVDDTPPQIFINSREEPDRPLQLSQLSDGYRTMLALVMDLARRMALAAQGKGFDNVLEYPAIVLIDEVELHLHPAWQQKVLPNLLKVFPNTQFIVTTHSPQVISSIEPRHIRILSDNHISLPSSSTYGAESQRILEEIFGVNARYGENEAKKTLDEYFKLINEGEFDSEKARSCRAKLDNWLRGDPALDSADMLIRRARRMHERSQSNAQA